MIRNIKKKVFSNLFECMMKKDIIAYERWYNTYNKPIATMDELSNYPLVSIVVPVYNCPRRVLSDCIESVKSQIYKNWELILVDDHSSLKETVNTLKDYEKEEKIIVSYHSENKQIAATTNDAIELANGEYIAFLDNDDVIEPDALYLMVQKANEGYEFIYTNEDHISNDLKEKKFPSYKSIWSPDTFASLNYTSHFSMYSASLIKDVNGLSYGVDGSQDYDLVYKVVEKTDKIAFVDKILYHWRDGAASTASNPESKMYAYEAAMEAKRRALERRNIRAKIKYIPQYFQSRVDYIPAAGTNVDIVINNSSNSNIDYGTIVNGDLNLNIIETHCKTFSEAITMGISESKGDVLIYINADKIYLPYDNHWINILTGEALLSHVGLVSPMIRDKNKLIFEAGLAYCDKYQSFGRVDKGYISGRGKRYMPCDIFACGPDVFACRKECISNFAFDDNKEDYYDSIDLSLYQVKNNRYNVLRPDIIFLRKTSEKTITVLKKEGALYLMHKYEFEYDPFYGRHYSDFEHNVNTGISNKLLHLVDYCVAIKHRDDSLLVGTEH